MKRTLFIKNNQKIKEEYLRQNGFCEDSMYTIRHSIERSIERGIFGVIHPLLLLWAMVRWEEKGGIYVLKKCGADLASLESDIELHLKELAKGQLDDLDCQKICQVAIAAMEEASLLGKNYVATEHVLLALLKTEDEILHKLFEKHRITYDLFKKKLKMVT